MANRKWSKKLRILLRELLMMICLFSNESQAKNVFIKIQNKLGELCYSNPAHYIYDVPKCNVTFEQGTCWPETQAGRNSTQRCSFILYEGKGMINRRCKESLTWEDMDTGNCRPLESNTGGQGGKLLGNNFTNQTATSSPEILNNVMYQGRVYEVFSWIAVATMTPSLLVLFVVRSPRTDCFTIHKNLILALLLQTVTYFIDYYGGLSHNTSQQTTCNVIWVLNQLSVAAAITWVLNESVYLVRLLRSPVVGQMSYFWYYFAFGWGFPTFLLVCLYIPSIQFTIGFRDTRCWSHHSQSLYMLVIYLPLTIVLALNMGTLTYVVYVTKRKIKLTVESNPEIIDIKKAVKKALLWMPLLSIVYILAFYIPEGNNGFDYFISTLYPSQGVFVCMVFVIFNTEVRNALKNTWTRWKTGNFSYAPGDSTRNNIKGHYGLEVESHSQNSPFLAHDENSPESIRHSPAIDKHHNKDDNNTPRSRSGKVVPEPSVPIRINVGSSTSFHSDNNDTMYLYRADNSNGIVAVKAAWNESLTSEQESILGEETEDNGGIPPKKHDLLDEPVDKVSGKGDISQSVSDFEDLISPQCQNAKPEDSFSNASQQKSEVEPQKTKEVEDNGGMPPQKHDFSDEPADIVSGKGDISQSLSEFEYLKSPQYQNAEPKDNFSRNASEQESRVQLQNGTGALSKLQQGKEIPQERKMKEPATDVPSLEYISSEDHVGTASKEEDKLASVEPPAGDTESDDKFQDDGPEPQNKGFYRKTKPKPSPQERWQAARRAAMPSGYRTEDSQALFVSPPAQQVLEQAKEGSEQRSKWIVELLSGLASQKKESEA